MRDIWCQVSDNRCLLSDIWCLMPDFCYQTSDAWFQMSGVRRLILDVWFQRSDVRFLSSDVWHLTSDVCYKTFDVRYLMSDVWRQTTNRSLTRNQTRDVWHQTTNIRHLIWQTSDMRHLTSENKHVVSWCQKSDVWWWSWGSEWWITHFFILLPHFSERTQILIYLNRPFTWRERCLETPQYSQLLSSWHLAVRDTQIKQKVAKSSAKKRDVWLKQSPSITDSL